MAGADYFIGQNDHGEQLADTLKDSAGNAVDISGATVKLTVAPIGGGVAVVNAVTASNDQNGDGSDGSKGKVHYVWQSADTVAAGMYLGRWTVTFGGGVVQSYPNGGYLLVEIAAATPIDTETRFVTSADLQARLGIDFTADDYIRADALLARASGLIQNETKQKIVLVTNDVYTRPGDYDTRVRLPERPVLSVASVMLNGVALTAGTNFFVDRDELVRLNWNSVIQDSSFGLPWAGWGFPWWDLVVTYTHGYAVVPELVKTVCMEAVVRVWVNPGSVARETVGNTSTVYDNNRFSPTGLLLTTEEKAQLNKLLRRHSGSLSLR